MPYHCLPLYSTCKSQGWWPSPGASDPPAAPARAPERPCRSGRAARSPRCCLLEDLLLERALVVRRRILKEVHMHCHLDHVVTIDGVREWRFGHSTRERHIVRRGEAERRRRRE